MNKGHGLIIPKIETKKEGLNYYLGSSKLKGEVINPTGKWKEYLPIGELQNKGKFEPNACASFATNHAIQTLYKFLQKKDVNYSDRALAIGSGTDPNRGNDPHKVIEYARTKLGFVPENVLPFDESIKTLEAFYSPNPLTQDIINEGNQFFNEYDISHGWVFNGGSSDWKQLKLKEALTKGTVCVSVLAWMKKDGKYIKPEGEQDNHWVQLVEYDENDCPVIFDSYAETDNTPYLKTLDPLYDFNIAKIYYLTPSQPKLDLFQKILNIIANLIPALSFLVEKKIEDIKKKEPKPIMEKETKEMVEEVKKPKIEDMARAIELFENAPKEWKNPGAIKGLDGKFLKFNSYQEGWNYLIDYLKRAITGKHRAYTGNETLLEFFQIYAPSEDKNDPLSYALFMSNHLKISIYKKVANQITI